MNIFQEYGNKSDEEILSDIIKYQRTELFSLLYNRYIEKVTNKCHSMVKDSKLAAEMANDILSKSFEKLPSYKAQSTFSTWLFSITYNHCIDYLRKKKKIHYPEWDSKQEMPEMIDEPDEDHTEVNYNKLLQVMELIHPEEKALILMRYQDNLSIRQISAALRISESAAKMRLKRARTRVIYIYTKKFNELKRSL